jgi:tetratricopeptide (TPR) repeat protein
MEHSMPPSEYIEKGLVFLNSPLKDKGKAALQEGMTKVALKKYAEAIPFFKKANGYGIKEAQTQIDALIARADAETAKGLKYLEEKNLLAARGFFQSLIRAYGENIASKAKEELNKIENDPAFVNEKKADELFLQIRNSYATAGKAKTAESLKKLIADYPDTTIMEKAKAALKSMGVQ